MGFAILFWDETGHTFRARCGTTWAPTGHPPLLRRRSQRREVSSIAALQAPVDAPPRLLARHFRGTIHAEEVLVALRYFRRRVGRPLLIIWDGLPAHRAKLVETFVATHPDDYRIEWLPPYAPELNPEELCNGAVKHELLNAAPDSVDALLHHARCRFIRLGRRPHVLRGFFQHVGLDVT